MNSSISFIYCDLAGVQYNFRKGLSAYLENVGSSYAAFAKEIEPIEKQLNTGTIRLEQALKYYEKYFQRLFTKDEFIAFLTDQFQPITPIHELIKNLSNRYSIGLLTNIFEGLFDILLKKQLIVSLGYYPVIQSFQEGLVKPDPRIYELATKKAQVPAEQILFIDDSPTYISAAKQAGWNAILYSDSDNSTFLQEMSDLLQP